MPNAKTHDAITLVTGAALIPITYVVLTSYYNQATKNASVDTALLVVAHLLSGIMFSPDLDIDSAIDNRWGPFFWIWRPYMWVVPHGSGLLSHGLVIPPLLRLAYFFVVCSLVFFGAAWVLAQVGILVPNYPSIIFNDMLVFAHDRPREVIAFLTGFVTGGAAHSIADWTTTSHGHHSSKHPRPWRIH
jgi:uncharacterized metal-binding protein